MGVLISTRFRQHGRRRPWPALALAVLWLSGLPASQAADPVFVHKIIDRNNPPNPHCKTVGDIDGDGFPDALAASSSDFQDGIFWYRYPEWSKHNIARGSYSTDMQVGDVDGDGDLDVVIPKGAHYGASVWWYENPRPEGDPATTAWTEHEIGEAPAHDVEVGDLDNDGKLDVVVRSGEMTLYLQREAGAWEQVPVSTRPREGTALGDVDRDGDLDIVINGYWLENPLPRGAPEAGGWREHPFAGGWPDATGVTLADINTDGLVDIVLAPSESAPGKLSWYEAPPDPAGGVWVEHVIDPTVEYLHTFKAGDIDRDGDLDLATAEMHQGTPPREVSVYYNDGAGLHWHQQVVATTGSHNLRLADIDHDGDLDIFGANHNNAAETGAPVEYWSNELNPGISIDNWARHVIDEDRPWPAVFLTAEDLDRDGWKDIVAGAWWYRNPGAPDRPWERRAVGSRFRNYAAAWDIDRDGDIDLLGTEGKGFENNPRLVWARNDGGSFTVFPGIGIGGGDFLQGVAVTRLGPQAPLNVILSWHQAKAGVEALTVPPLPGAEPWPIRLLSQVSEGEEVSDADIDRDGDIDLLLGTKWLRNSGNGTFSVLSLASNAGLPDRSELADVNRDGRLDAVVGFEKSDPWGKLAWYEQPADAGSAWAEHVVGYSDRPMSLDVGDLDGDGDVDIVVGEHSREKPNAARLLLYENADGAGGRWIEHLLFTGDEHHDGTQLTDIDNDGDLDIISIGYTHPRVLVYENLNHPRAAVASQLVISEVTVKVSFESVRFTWITNRPATSQVRYGPDAALESFSPLDAALRTAHEVTISGLGCGRTYYFSLLAVDQAGAGVASPPATFRTAACLAGGPVSDGFHFGVAAPGLWTFLDPRADSSFSVRDGALEITVPAGRSHDVWTTGNHAARLVQVVPDADFSVVARFDSVVAKQYQMQGILVEQDAENFVRLDAYHDGAGAKVLVAALSGLNPVFAERRTLPAGGPIWFRLERRGRRWAASWSMDGETFTLLAAFTHSMEVQLIGPFAANHGRPEEASPAFTARVASFLNTAAGEGGPAGASPVQITSVRAETSRYSAQVSWKTSEPAGSRVLYGKTRRYDWVTPLDINPRRAHAVALAGLECSTRYHFRVVAVGSGGGPSVARDRRFTTTNCPPAPVSDEFNVGSVKPQWAFVNPVGDGSYSVEAGQLELFVPGGLDHDIWVDGDAAVRLMQPAGDLDLEVEAGFHSPVAAQYQIQGILVEQDPLDFLRIDMHHNGDGPEAFVAAFTGGQPVLEQRMGLPAGAACSRVNVQRKGDSWRVEYWSATGVLLALFEIHHELAMKRIGLFSGNEGASGNPAPEFVSRIDYFRVVRQTSRGDLYFRMPPAVPEAARRVRTIVPDNSIISRPAPSSGR